MKLFLIDGHALIFKMYYAFLGRPMVNTKGVDTSILFGFTKYLLELIAREQPTHLAVSFDPPGGTFRNKLYPQYKANRSETPQLVIDALEPLTNICKALDIPVLMIPGFEADDVIGSASKSLASDCVTVYMVTPDKDYGQLVSDNILQYRPGKAGADSEILGPAQVCEKWGIDNTSQVIDILTLCGDSSDNVPGVSGVGPVGAAKLLKKYGSVEQIYSHLDELTARQQELFKAAQGHIAMSKELVTIKTDVDFGVSLDQMALSRSHKKEIFDLLDFYEMRSLKRHLTMADESQENEPESSAGVKAPECQMVSVDAIISKVRECGRCATVASEDGNMMVASQSEDVFIYASAPYSAFQSILSDSSIVKYGHDLKHQMHLVGAFEGRLMDVELLHYLINPERSHKLENLVPAYLGYEIDQNGQASDGLLFAEIESTGENPLCCASLLPLGDVLYEELTKLGADSIYNDIEEPLIGVLYRMETAGVRVDPSSLAEFAESLRHRMLLREKEVRQIAGDDTLNVASPKQIGELVFEKLALDPKAKKPTKGSWPTDEETLSALSNRSPVIEAILDYRGTRKLLSTYIEPLPSYIAADGRVHTTFNQALTSTGRLSSSNPNLQNIPIRTEEGREIRKAFVAQADDSVIMSADYSQVELRVMAHLSCDQHLIAAFRSGQDVHAATASKIFNVPVEEVTADQRRMAKTANFGIMYGISSFGLAQRLGCSRSEASKLIEDYFASFPSVKSFINDTLSIARETGYVETISGRRRYVPDLTSHNGNVRAFAERNAVNAPIQGTAADIIKLAMIRVDKALREMNLSSRMVLQIHDELVLEVPVSEIDVVKELLTREMEGVMALSVPLTAECNYGKNWLEAH